MLFLNKESENENQINEPAVPYSMNIKIFHSFEEQEEFDRKEMAMLTPIQRLQHLRTFINIAYGMHGYNPNNLPTKHSIEIIDLKIN